MKFDYISIGMICGTVLIIFIIFMLRVKNPKLKGTVGKLGFDLSGSKEDAAEYKKYKTLSLQMDMADTRILMIINHMRNVYQVELERIKDDAARSDEMINYYNFTLRVYLLMKEDIKKFFRKNGFFEMTKEEFDKERIATVDNIIDAMNQEMIYFTGRLIGKKDWDELYLNKYSEIVYETLKDICDVGRKLSGQGQGEDK